MQHTLRQAGPQRSDGLRGCTFARVHAAAWSEPPLLLETGAAIISYASSCYDQFQLRTCFQLSSSSVATLPFFIGDSVRNHFRLDQIGGKTLTNGAPQIHDECAAVIVRRKLLFIISSMLLVLSCLTFKGFTRVNKNKASTEGFCQEMQLPACS